MLRSGLVEPGFESSLGPSLDSKGKFQGSGLKAILDHLSVRFGTLPIPTTEWAIGLCRVGPCFHQLYLNRLYLPSFCDKDVVTFGL